MGIKKPYHRFYRRFAGDLDKPMNPYGYLTVRDYAEHPELYVRSFKMIQADVQKLFEYVEPADKNIKTYSMQIYNLFFRICVEVEANFKAILRENTYHGTGEWWNMGDYRKVNKTHHLSGYKVTFPVWNGEKRTFAPFADWATDDPEAKLEWYDIYNSCKHNKYQYMERATLGTMLNAFAGLFVLLTAQFGSEEFEPGSVSICCRPSEDALYQGELGIGDYLEIEGPNDWTEEELYSFNWKELRLEKERFQKYDYNKE